MWTQWLPESARYDVLTGNQEKALDTLKRIAKENGAPMPLGKLIADRQVQHTPCVEHIHVIQSSVDSAFVFYLSF